MGGAAGGEEQDGQHESGRHLEMKGTGVHAGLDEDGARISRIFTEKVPAIPRAFPRSPSFVLERRGSSGSRMERGPPQAGISSGLAFYNGVAFDGAECRRRGRTLGGSSPLWRGGGVPAIEPG